MQRRSINIYMDSYIAGVLFGDGTYNKSKSGAYYVWIDQHERNLSILDRVSKTLQADGYKIYRYKVPDNKHRVLTYSKKLFVEFSALRGDPVTHFKNLNKRNKMKFVSGFFDAEGTYTDRIVIYNSHLGLLKEVQNFLKTIGIFPAIYKFGKIFGLQLYKKEYVEIFKKNINSTKIASSELKNVAG